MIYIEVIIREKVKWFSMDNRRPILLRMALARIPCAVFYLHLVEASPLMIVVGDMSVLPPRLRSVPSLSTLRKRLDRLVFSCSTLVHMTIFRTGARQVILPSSSLELVVEVWENPDRAQLCRLCLEPALLLEEIGFCFSNERCCGNADKP